MIERPKDLHTLKIKCSSLAASEAWMPYVINLKAQIEQKSEISTFEEHDHSDHLHTSSGYVADCAQLYFGAHILTTGRPPHQRFLSPH